MEPEKEIKVCEMVYLAKTRLCVAMVTENRQKQPSKRIREVI